MEQHEQVTILEHLGCQTIQGYYISRPLSAAQFEEHLEQGFNLGGVAPREAVSS